MIEVTVDQLAEAVENMHGGKACFVEAEEIREFSGERIAWQGIVHIFDLAGHPTATRAYAWSSPIEGSDKRRFYAVLHVPPVSSPADAVRAAIVADHKARR